MKAALLRYMQQQTYKLLLVVSLLWVPGSSEPAAAGRWSTQMQQQTYKLLLVVSLLWVPGSSEPAAAGRWSTQITKPRTWAYFSIQSHQFTGRWHNYDYQATVFLRVVCLNHTTRAVRMVLSLHGAPLIQTNGKNAAHSDTPAWHVHSSSNSSVTLPRVWFLGPNNVSVKAAGNDWEYHASKMTTAALMANVHLPRDVPFIVGMQGSERVYHVTQSCGPKQHSLFRKNSVWLGVVSSEQAFASLQQSHPYQQHAARRASAQHTTILTSNGSRQLKHNASSAFRAASSRHTLPVGITPSEAKRFVVQQHLQHHMRLGFAGSIMVVMKHTAEALMHSRMLRQAVSRKELVLVLWDMGLEPRASHLMQIPANNLLRLAAWGSSTTLGLWDLDEFMVMPQHTTIQQEMQSGCLQGALSYSPEAIVPSTWASSTAWTAGPEVLGWVSNGHWASAVADMQYVCWQYRSCSGVCKALVNPNSDMLFQVHEHHAAPHETMHATQLPRSCAYLLHFYRLWAMRTPQLMSQMGAGTTPGAPLQLQDVLYQHTPEAA